MERTSLELSLLALGVRQALASKTKRNQTADSLSALWFVVLPSSPGIDRPDHIGMPPQTDLNAPAGSGSAPLFLGTVFY
jgi:hypothetical protein